MRAAFAIAEAIIEREVLTVPGRGETSLRRAAALICERTTAVARMHPHDIEVMGDISDLAQRIGVTVVSDATMVLGDCILDLPSSRIEMILSASIERARAVLFGESHSNSEVRP